MIYIDVSRVFFASLDAILCRCPLQAHSRTLNERSEFVGAERVVSYAGTTAEAGYQTETTANFEQRKRRACAQ